MTFGRKLLKRLLSTIFVLFGISIVAFTLVRVAPGNPAKMMLPDTATEEQIEAMEEQMGLDKPYIVQYGTFYDFCAGRTVCGPGLAQLNVDIDIRRYFKMAAHPGLWRSEIHYYAGYLHGISVYSHDYPNDPYRNGGCASGRLHSGNQGQRNQQV